MATTPTNAKRRLVAAVAVASGSSLLSQSHIAAALPSAAMRRPSEPTRHATSISSCLT